MIARRLGNITDAGGTTGFDYLRLIPSISVLAWHSAGIVYGRDQSIWLSGSPLGYIVWLILPMFFALSGFLVTSSLMRSATLIEFMGLRILRLIPALAVEITLSAIILGPLLTALPLSGYFSDEKFYQYFFNIFGFIHYELPGLFLDNPIKGIVNGSLWTVPFELECYISLALIWLIGLRKSPVGTLIALAGWCGLLAVAGSLGRYTPFAPDALNGRMMVGFFLAGVVVYHYRHRLPHDPRLFALAIVASVAMIKSPALVYAAPLPVAYATAYLGLLNPRHLPIVFKGDYSYGIYLYAFPIQQTVYLLLPQMHFWVGHFATSLLATSMLAAFSWHTIEKPLLRFKRLLRRRATPAMIDPAISSGEARASLP